MTHCRWASRMDEFLKLDLADFEREWFKRWHVGRVTWSRGGRETGSLRYRLGPDDMELSYRHGRGDTARDVVERIPFAFTEQPLGGRRRWLICISCERRCRVLIGGAYFRCRQCYGATYPSQYETIRAPGLVRGEAARKRVGAEPGFSNPFPPKPKGMHWRTYQQLEALNWDAVLAIERVLVGVIRRRPR